MKVVLQKFWSLCKETEFFRPRRKRFRGGGTVSLLTGPLRWLEKCSVFLPAAQDQRRSAGAGVGAGAGAAVPPGAENFFPPPGLTSSRK